MQIKRQNSFYLLFILLLCSRIGCFFLNKNVICDFLEMNIIHTINVLTAALAVERESRKTIGFVPTMGALHDGHISLVRQCKRETGVCVVSIFVNPTQFNDKNDLNAYPRTIQKDYELLASAGCDYVFVPSEDEMYPEPDNRIFNLGRVAEVLEGASRPGHFNGVAQVISKLFHIVKPDNAYFGEKDYQQIAVVRVLVKKLKIRVNLIACPVVREDDGLAMSSRNIRLTPEQRLFAPMISRTLKESLNFAPFNSIKTVEGWVTKTLNETPCLRVDYFSIVNSQTLRPLKTWNKAKTSVGCIAVYCGDVRLIDNIKYDYLK